MKSEIKVVEGCLPLRLEGTNGKAVIVQHGYNGYPNEMFGLAERIHKEGYTVVVPRLPGHATCAEDFRNTNWRLWLNHIRNVYIELSSEFESVTVVGLSMGGLLSIMLAAEFDPEKIILLAPAIDVKPRLLYYTPLLRFVRPVIKREWQPDKEPTEIRKKLAAEYWSYVYTAQVANLIKLIKKARKALPQIECPVFMMFSEIDTHVPLTAPDIIESGVKTPIKKHILKNSPHVFFEGPENDFVLEKVTEWLNDDFAGEKK